MSNTSAMILWDTRNGEEPLPVALCSDLPVATLDTVGPGRLLHEAYSAAGRAVEQTLGRAAHKLGSGPTATTCRIEKAFGDGALTRQSRLDSLYDSFREGTQRRFLGVLKKDCSKLLKYALPSQSLATQIDTFRSIIVLTTRYPGLRRIFLQSPDMAKVPDSPDAICERWQSTEYNYDKESGFMLEFAAHCLARHDPNIELERIRPRKLGRACKEGLGVVDRLLVRYCDGGSGFPRLIAIRYLAGILELSTFWIENYEVQKFTMDKLCKQALRLIEDVNPDSLNADDIGRLALLDPDGVDAFADAILVGGQGWLQRIYRIKRLGSHSWLTSFVKLIEVLRGLIVPDLLPMASRRASGNWEALLKNVTDQLPISSLDYQYEDFYVFVNGRLDSQSATHKPPRFNQEPSDIAEGPSSVLKAFTTAFRSIFLGRTVSNIDSLNGETDARGKYGPDRPASIRQNQRTRDDLDSPNHRRPPSSPSSTEESETAIRYNFPLPGPPHSFQPLPPVITDRRPSPQRRRRSRDSRSRTNLGSSDHRRSRPSESSSEESETASRYNFPAGTPYGFPVDQSNQRPGNRRYQHQRSRRRPQIDPYLSDSQSSEESETAFRYNFPVGPPPPLPGPPHSFQPLPPVITDRRPSPRRRRRSRDSRSRTNLGSPDHRRSRSTESSSEESETASRYNFPAGTPHVPFDQSNQQPLQQPHTPFTNWGHDPNASRPGSVHPSASNHHRHASSTATFEVVNPDLPQPDNRSTRRTSSRAQPTLTDVVANGEDAAMGFTPRREASRASLKSAKSYSRFNPNEYVDPAYWGVSGPGDPPAALPAQPRPDTDVVANWEDAAMGFTPRREASRASLKSAKSYSRFNPNEYVDPAYWGVSGPGDSPAALPGMAVDATDMGRAASRLSRKTSVDSGLSYA